MTTKSVLMRPQGLRPGARTPTCPPCYVTSSQHLTPFINELTIKLKGKSARHSTTPQSWVLTQCLKLTFKVASF